MAERLIESFTTEWKPEKYKDTYRDELCAIIRAKRKGKEVHAAPDVEEEAPTDLLTALRESIERSRGGRTCRPQRRPRRPLQAGARQARESGRHRGPVEDDEGGARARAGAACSPRPLRETPRRR